MMNPITRRPPRFEDRSLGTVELAGGHLRLCERIGKGNNSTVYRAILRTPYGLERAVAVKMFDGIADDEFDAKVESFAALFRRSAAVRHPNVVAIHDFGVARERPFVVMDLVEGVTLRTLLDRHAAHRRRIRLDLALFVAVEVADALAGAWGARDHEGRRVDLLHLDLSPREIFLCTDGSVKVEGFELSTLRGLTSSICRLDALASRVATLSPEVADGHQGDARSDVFSFGAILRELLIGPRFPKFSDPREGLRLAREGYVEPMTFQPNLPPELLHVMSRSLAIDPGQRFPSLGSVVSILRGVALSMGVADGRHFLRDALAHVQSSVIAAPDPDEDGTEAVRPDESDTRLARRSRPAPSAR